jgi:hypothetical protein
MQWYEKIMTMKSKPKNIAAPDGGTVIDVEDNTDQK